MSCASIAPRASPFLFRGCLDNAMNELYYVGGGGGSHSLTRRIDVLVRSLAEPELSLLWIQSPAPS